MAVDDSRLRDDEYRLAFNVRSRFGELTPIKRPIEIDTAFTDLQDVDNVYVTTTGTGYTDGTYNFGVNNTGSGGSGFAGTYTISSGAIASTLITNRGKDYTSAPTVTVDETTSGTAAVLEVEMLSHEYPMQGVYTIGDFILLAKNGELKYKHRLASTWVSVWEAGDALRMDTSAQMYFQAVPGSIINFERQSKNADEATGLGDNNSIKLRYDTTPWVKTVAGVVIQNGIDQPRLVEFRTTSTGAQVSGRLCKTFTEWGTGSSGEETREYVPIGKQMLFFDGKLYVVSPDGTKIYHSVTGRPLDFVVPINTSGAKIASSEAAGGAEVVSYSVSYESITCISALNTDSIFVSTRTASYAVTPNYNHTLFGEPTFSKKYLFSASVVNQHSFVDILGDFAFIDAEGLRSFNAVQQLRNEGRNSAFSLSVAKLFQGIVQNGAVTAAISFDNYSFFAVNTIHGFGVLVYDGTSRKFVSLDMVGIGDAETEAPSNAPDTTTFRKRDANLGYVTQFTKIDSDTTHELYALTSKGKLLQLYAGAKYLPASLVTQAWSTGDPRVEQKPQELRLLFNSVEAWEANSITLTSGSYSGTTSQTINVAAIPYSLASGTIVTFVGTATATGGTFTLDAAAAKGDTTLSGSLSADSGTLTSGSSPVGWVRFDGAGTVSAKVIANGRASATPGLISKTIKAPSANGIAYADTYPLMWASENMVQNLLYNFQQGRYGWKLGYVISWDTNATLSLIQHTTQDMTPKNPLMTQAYGS